MITTQQMYWLTRLDSLCKTHVALLVVCIVAAVVLYIIGAAILDYDDGYSVKHLRAATMLVCSAVVLLIVGTFIPTSREMAAIIVIPKIVNNEKVQEAGNKLYDLAVEWLDALKPAK